MLVLLSQPVLLLPSSFDLCSFSLLSSSSSSSIQGQKEKVVLVLIWGDPVYLKIARDLVSDDVMHVPKLRTDDATILSRLRSPTKITFFDKIFRHINL